METFKVTHAKARNPLTIKGKTLEEALKKSGLDPNIWKEVSAQPESEDTDLGDYQGDGGPADY